jgi:hypothetical protein
MMSTLQVQSVLAPHLEGFTFQWQQAHRNAPMTACAIGPTQTPNDWQIEPGKIAGNWVAWHRKGTRTFKDAAKAVAFCSPAAKPAL